MDPAPVGRGLVVGADRAGLRLFLENVGDPGRGRVHSRTPVLPSSQAKRLPLDLSAVVAAKQLGPWFGSAALFMSRVPVRLSGWSSVASGII